MSVDKNSKLYCVWADAGLALHNSGRAYLCCHSRTYLRDQSNELIYFHKNDLQEAWNSPTRREIQDALERGERHYNCQACWDEEDAGRPSRRVLHNEINAHLPANPPSPKVMDLKLGNTCNLACRTCWPEVSSKWVNDFYEISIRPTGQSHKDYLKTWDTIQLSYDRENEMLWSRLREYITDVEYIDIFGAEPMLLARLFDILGYCADAGIARDQRLHVNTNGTIWNQRYIDILTQFKEVQLDLSIDGLGPQFDYIRYGETWETMQENVQRYRKLAQDNPNIILRVCVTVCSLNVYYLPEIFDYFREQQIGTFINLVHKPDYLNVRTLPDAVKSMIHEKFNGWSTPNPAEQNFIDQLHRFLDLPMDDQPKYWAEFCDKTQRLDQLRGQDFAATFPEFHSIVQSHWVD